jgi:hypothetical protein
MNGERYPGESLPFAPLMRYANGRLVAIIELTNLWFVYRQNEAKMLDLFNAWRALPRNLTARASRRQRRRRSFVHAQQRR